MRKAQGAFEYVLLLGGVLLIVVLAVVLLRGGLFQSGSQNVELNACKNSLVTAPGCFDGNGVWNTTGVATVTTSCHDTLVAASYTCPSASTCLCGEAPA